MSVIVGPDGKTPLQSSDAPRMKYRAGGLSFESPLPPDALLTKAVAGAREAIGAQVYQATLQKTGSPTAAQAEASTAASTIGDPFVMEPAAMAVFMYLSREIEYRDLVIAQMNERLVSLGAKPLDVEHPYPVPVPEEAPPETLPEENEPEASAE
jgi:hypothetical protein